MKSKSILILLTIFMIASSSCTKKKAVKIIFLHHSTGKAVWNGNNSGFLFNIGRVLNKVSGKTNPFGALPKLIKEYNKNNNTNYIIQGLTFPKKKPYGWKNYPYDYYNIWVKHGGLEPFQNEPTLEILTKKYDIIILKHCFPVSNIVEDTMASDINSDIKSVANYKLQYEALKRKMLNFPNTKFIIWTGAALTKGSCPDENLYRAKQFFSWVKSDWDDVGDNIFIWDFHHLETEGGLYLKNEFSTGNNNSHPSPDFCQMAAESLSARIINIIEGRGDTSSILGK